MSDLMFDTTSSGPSGDAAVLGAHVLLFDQGRVLLTQRAAEAAYAPLCWHASVAGKVEPGESVLEAALREASEELGIVLAPCDLEFARSMHSAENGSRLHVFFVARTWQGDPVNTEPHKPARIAWHPAHRLPDATVGYCAQAVEAYLIGAPFSEHGFARGDATAADLKFGGAACLGDAGVAGSLELVLGWIAAERRRQQRLYGIQDLAGGNGPDHRTQEEQARSRVEDPRRRPTFYDLAFEELSEARAADGDEDVLGELVQTAAVLVQWVQAVLGSRRPQQTDTAQQTHEQ